jgi:hypothetical protein
MEESATGEFRAFRQALTDLRESYRIADVQLARGNPDRYLLIRFEELLADPNRTIDRLAAFLDVENLPLLRRPTTAGRSATANSSFDVNASGAIVPGRARIDDRTLSNGERLRLAATVGDAAATLGYAVPA